MNGLIGTKKLILISFQDFCMGKTNGWVFIN